MGAALKVRDDAWKDADCIPDWVRGRSIGLDQFNTDPKIATYCWKSLQSVMKKRGAKIDDYKFIEPSAGTGAFYDLLPVGSRVGVDVEAYRSNYICSDFLTWKPHVNGKRYAAIGNPPFGYRGWLALAFINHAARWCDYVGFILPMSFQSDGKSTPKHRVMKGMKLIHSEVLPGDSFIKPDGSPMNVNTLWQIWARGELMPARDDLSICDQYFELITVDLRPERRCGHRRMKECDYFLQRTFYSEPPNLVRDFKKVRYCCGYGIIFKKDVRRITKLLRAVDWNKYSNLTTHHCHHISMYHIRQSLLDAGLCNG